MRIYIYGMSALMLFASGSTRASDDQFNEILNRYQNNLPVLTQSESPGAPDIVHFLAEFRSPKYRGIQLPEEDQLCTHIQELMETERPLRLTLPSFPLKSKNTEMKVLGPDPDLGEVVALLTLGHICQQIGSIYKPGAHVILQADGFYAVEALDLPDEDTRLYVSQVKLLIRYFKLEDRVMLLSPDELPDERVKGKAFGELRTLLDDQMAVVVPQESLDARAYFCASELECEYYRTKLKARALEKAKKNRCYRLDLVEEHERLSGLSYDQVIELPTTAEQKALIKFKGCCENGYNSERKQFPKEMNTCIVKRAIQFKMLLDQIYDRNQVIRLKIHMDDKPVMSQRLPVTIVYNNDDVPGTPWHHTPSIRLIGNVGIQILMVPRSPFQTVKQARLSGLPFPIKWVE